MISEKVLEGLKAHVMRNRRDSGGTVESYTQEMTAGAARMNSFKPYYIRTSVQSCSGDVTS